MLSFVYSFSCFSRVLIFFDYASRRKIYFIFPRHPMFFIGKFNDLKTMLERDDIDGMRAMMRHSTERRALFDEK